MSATVRAPRAFPYALLLPSLVAMLLVVLFPLLYNVFLSFRNMNLYHFTDHRFVGLANYRELFASPELYVLFIKSVLWTVLNVTFHVVIGLILALLLAGPVRLRGMYRTLLILPWAMPQYISALTWRGMFNYEFGALNLILQRLHLPAVPWLSDPVWAFVSPVIVNIWLGFPFMMVVCLGALTAIPRDLYEAAELDGAGAWHRFRHVTWPQIQPVLTPAVLLGTVWTFNNMVVIWLVSQQGRPADQTHIMVTWIYKVAFTYYRYSYAAAFSMVVFLILLGFVIFTLRRAAPLEAK
jgi:arabinogalactan oligomer / maltooligosaccharide transport system permease protein